MASYKLSCRHVCNLARVKILASLQMESHCASEQAQIVPGIEVALLATKFGL